MNPVQFDWDEDNIGHLGRHQIEPGEAEQVILNRPCDLETHIRSGESRVVQVGETNSGRVLVVVSTMRGKHVRIITAWPAEKRLQRYFSTQKKSGNAGRVAEEEFPE